MHDLSFGRLTVKKRAEKTDSSGNVYWHCECECGNVCIVAGHKLRSGHSQSCGCYRRDRVHATKTKHGHAKPGHISTEYRIWQNMLNRCQNPKTLAYADYGGRGISVVERWRNDFRNFLTDMGPRPSPAHTLDRIDNDGNYSPENCRWATKAEQANNRRSSVYGRLNGKRLTLAEAAKATGMPYSKFYDRVTVQAMTFDEAAIAA